VFTVTHIQFHTSVSGLWDLQFVNRLSDEIKRVALTFCSDIAQKKAQYKSYFPYKEVVLFCKL